MTSRRAKKPPKTSYHHGNLRAALIEAGLRLIAEKGVRALTLREIGARVGVSRMAAYRHFADKSALLAAIREAGFSDFADALEAAREKAGPKFVERMAAMALAYVHFSQNHAAHFEVMFAPAPADSWSEAGHRAFDILVKTIREGQQSGDVRPGDPTLLASATWALVHGMSALQLQTLNGPTGSSDTGSGDDFVLACSGLLMKGLLASGSS